MKQSTSSFQRAGFFSWLVLMTPSFSSAFVLPDTSHSALHSPSSAISILSLKAYSFNAPENDNSIVQASKLPGNLGFDPLHFAQTRQQLVTYRQAEMKHARLAMLAVLSILWSDWNVVDTIGATPILEGRAFPEFLGACIGFPASLELYAERIDRQHEKYIQNEDDDDPSYFPGNLELDPFHLYPRETRGQRRMQFAEIMTGRLCMLAAAVRLGQNTMEALGIDNDVVVSWFPSLTNTITETVDTAVV